MHAKVFMNYAKRSAWISSKLRPSSSSVARFPVSCSHRHTMRSRYWASISKPQQTRPVSSAATSEVPEPKKAS